MSTHTSENHNAHTDMHSQYWTTQRIAIYALFSTVAIILSFIEIPLFPALAPYLKYDPSGVVILLAGFAYGPLASLIISVLSTLPHLFVNPIGAFISLACMLAFALPAAWIYTSHRTRTGAIVSMIIGAIFFIAVALGLNVLITPFYSAVPRETVIAMIIPILLPFNIIKAGLHLFITVLCYKPITSLLKAFIRSQKASRRV